MITFDRHAGRFNHRTAGACLHDDHVLLQRADREDYWALPGGRVELQEDTRTALRREMREELGCDVEVGRLLWVVENFFPLSEKDYHEVSFVYEIQPSDPEVLRKTRTFAVVDGGVAIRFAWFPLRSLAEVELKPSFLRQALPEPPAVTTHLVIRE